MNTQQSDILLALSQHPFSSQRQLSECTGHSLGIVNRSVRELIAENYLDQNYQLTDKAVVCLNQNKPANAVILAAGFGMRMVPINSEIPKALLEVHGETLIERQIRQLHEAGIHNISVVAGFMKESLEYLIDSFGVKLIINEQYAIKGNFHSLLLASENLSNTYIIPCDIWCKENPFRSREMNSWYMVREDADPHSQVRINRKSELVWSPDTVNGNTMIGICYLNQKDGPRIRDNILQMENNPACEREFWEEALYEHNRMTINVRVVSKKDAVEINTYEQLRDLDKNSSQLKSKEIDIICKSLSCNPDDITKITVQKKGMTNRSFLFTCRGKKYIMRIPGEGTEQLINRQQEAQVYERISGLGICDNIIYIDPASGFKITEFIEGARVCDPENQDDLKKCMEKLRNFHALDLQTDHSFDIFGKIQFYESLWNGTPSVYRDYETTKKNVFSLLPYIEAHTHHRCLTHIDAIPDNFLLFSDEKGEENIRLIDWEYAGMQDPHVDLAMFCIYALYSREQADQLIDLYFNGKCTKENRLKIYCYIAACGLLWSNWCEYKRNLGIEFGEYALRQYRFAKDFYRIFQDEINK